MPAHASIYQLLGMAFLALVTVAWGIGLALMLSRGRERAALWRAGQTLSALPRQREVGPPRESVELSPAERDAFAVLVRRLGADR
ncbi:hypothetical protein SLINC_3627 [Streptomyces lincolnensis]|uniref:Uncharacterized protein n=1 Tax=Streptomyces lincolnensis TaxID=1915 RepID=A0A1B1MB74_STRLN|nr:hypothetical protein [Streptomyces lincolnensis]ANS65851.1 hypothetical protein SLINC_3627 [Streptomyces lincolnensis]AXG54386.1 hypothetical protein SLCG_3231 [Streptomyces lincolnensis]QMV08761.1 hypothetical protein GJU35_26050 [Streptomyces lincolnensis]